MCTGGEWGVHGSQATAERRLADASGVKLSAQLVPDEKISLQLHSALV